MPSTKSEDPEDNTCRLYAECCPWPSHPRSLVHLVFLAISQHLHASDSLQTSVYQPTTTMLILLLVTTLIWMRSGAEATPISAGPSTIPTIIHTVIFGVHHTRGTGCSEDNANIRSMYDILRSCLFTIAACVYRAIHPNIPDPNATLWKKMVVMVKIVVYALIAPEMMIYWAMRQRAGANLIMEKVNRIKPELKWTQTHGQFAQMGGFGWKDTKHILYPPTLINLLESDQLDIEELGELTEKEINDKSKGDILSKGLVAFQTTWFVFECLARLQQGLPLIELEVVTLAFATLNAITYTLWWYKPLNVFCPIYLRIQSNSPNLPRSSGSHLRDGTTSGSVDAEERPLIGGASDGNVDVQDAVTKPDGKANPIGSAIGGLVGAIAGVISGVIDLVNKDLKTEGLWNTIGIWLLEKPFLAMTSPLWELLSDENTLDDVTHVSSFYGMEIPTSKTDRVTLYSSIIGMMFGAVHFLSWHSTFGSHTQLVLWRTSTVVLVVQPFLILTTNVFAILDERATADSVWKDLVHSIWAVLMASTLLGGTVCYIFARFCVLVLSFLTLRDLPLGAFVNVSWTSYIPHF